MTQEGTHLSRITNIQPLGFLQDFYMGRFDSLGLFLQIIRFHHHYLCHQERPRAALRHSTTVSYFSEGIS